MLAFAKDMANGLCHVHKLGYAHCDMKRANVLIDIQNSREVCVLTDFGFSQVNASRTAKVKALTLVTKIALTERYAAPEVFERFNENEPSQVEKDDQVWARIVRSGDLYGLAIIIYEMLTNQKAWDNVQVNKRRR